MVTILNLETATEICSVALSNEKGVIDFLENTEGKSHASLLTVFIENILKSNNLKVADISAVAVSEGPGSYTGLRIGVAAAKGLCYGTDIPLISVPTLQVITQSFLDNYKQKVTLDNNTLLCPMIDARRSEVYTAFFNQKGEIISEISALIISNTTFQTLLYDKTIYFFGNGANKCKSLIQNKNAIFIDNIYPSAKYMTELSTNYYKKNNFKNIAYFEPYYLKDFIATIPKNKVINKGA